MGSYKNVKRSSYGIDIQIFNVINNIFSFFPLPLFHSRQSRLSHSTSSSVWRSWSHRLRPKNLHASVAVPVALVWIPSQRPLAPSVAPVTSVANDKGDNEMIQGVVHTSPCICLTAEENLS